MPKCCSFLPTSKYELYVCVFFLQLEPYNALGYLGHLSSIYYNVFLNRLSKTWFYRKKMISFILYTITKMICDSTSLFY